MKYRCFNCLGKGGGFHVSSVDAFPEKIACYFCKGRGHLFTADLAPLLKCSASSIRRIEDDQRRKGNCAKVAARVLPLILALAEQERLCVQQRDRKAARRAG